MQHVSVTKMKVYGKGFMAFIDVIYPESAADLTSLPHNLRQEMKDLRRLVAASLRKWDAIPAPRPCINEDEVVPAGADVTLFLGDSLFNDGKERESKNMVFLSMARDWVGSNTYVAAFPGDKVSDILQRVDQRKCLKKISKKVSPEHIRDIILGGGVNDILALLDRGDILRISWSRVEGLLDKVADSFVDTVRALKTFIPGAAIHVSHVMNHPRVVDHPRGAQIRDYMSVAISRRLGNRVTHFRPQISKEAWTERGNDGLHLSARGKWQYTEQLHHHFCSIQPFRPNWSHWGSS